MQFAPTIIREILKILEIRDSKPSDRGKFHQLNLKKRGYLFRQPPIFI